MDYTSNSPQRWLFVRYLYETCYSLTNSGNINTLVGFHCPVCQKISSFCHDVCPGTTFAIAICICLPFRLLYANGCLKHRGWFLGFSRHFWDLMCFLTHLHILLVFLSGLSFVVDQRVYSYMPTACTTTTQDQICLVSCKPRSSSATWLAYAMVSFSCSGQ